MKYDDVKPIRIIPGPAGIFQTDRIHKLPNVSNAPAQEYIRKLINDVSEDDDFKRGMWVKTFEFMNDGGEIEDLCNEVTGGVKKKVKVIEEVKEVGGPALGSDNLAYLRILRDEDLDKAKYIMKLIKETQEHTREKYAFIAKIKVDRK
nr:hypothetical protein [Tanacetum cinerariifolium]